MATFATDGNHFDEACGPGPGSISELSSGAVKEAGIGRASPIRLLLTPTEAAAALGIGRSKLYELLRSGVVPSVTIGTCRRIALSDLSAVIEALRPVRPCVGPGDLAH